MNVTPCDTIRRLGLIGAFILVMSVFEAHAREAAFVDPGASGGNATEGALKVEPKAEIDTGETELNVAKRTTLFFVNQTNQPIQIEKVTVNADGNVTAEVTNDDCSKQATIGPLSRCSVEISVTPSSPGPWGVNALLTHNGAGRIAEAKLTGKTTGSTAVVEKKDTGLAVSTKDVTPVNFGDVEAGSGKAVRSALMVNDSPDPITIYSVDVIEAGNGLQRLDQGCAIDMELKPGESCPVTLVWTPTDAGQISTDLIIRHSGRLGFAVVPIRGNAKGVTLAKGKESPVGRTVTIENKGTPIPSPPSAQDLERAVQIAPIAASSLSTNTSASSSASGALRLIGTVGNRGVFLTADGNTAVSASGEDFDSDGKKVKVISVSAKSADVTVDGRKEKLVLGSSPELITRNSNHVSSASGPLSPSTLPIGTTIGPSTATASSPSISTTPLLPPPATSSAGMPK